MLPRSPARSAKPEPLATPEQLAEILDIPEHTLAQWRSQGKGPAFLRVGRHVRYSWPAVNAWLATCEISEDLAEQPRAGSGARGGARERPRHPGAAPRIQGGGRP